MGCGFNRSFAIYLTILNGQPAPRAIIDPQRTHRVLVGSLLIDGKTANLFDGARELPWPVLAGTGICDPQVEIHSALLQFCV